MTAFPFELMIAMMHMIGEGVFDRFPKLRVGFMEGGAGWLPFWMERFDEHIEKLAPQMPDLKRRPSEIIKSEQIILTCESEETGLDRVLDAAGAGTVFYASDYCHWDCHFPDSVKDMVEAQDLNFEQKEKFLASTPLTSSNSKICRSPMRSRSLTPAGPTAINPRQQRLEDIRHGTRTSATPSV